VRRASPRVFFHHLRHRVQATHAGFTCPSPMNGAQFRSQVALAPGDSYYTAILPGVGRWPTHADTPDIVAQKNVASESGQTASARRST
jgi:hypothetical protein